MMGDTAESIYLPRLPAFKENTYCVDQADNDTVEYIRADLHQKALDHIEELEAENARLEDAFQLYVDANERVLELEAKVGRVEVLEDVLREIANGAINDNGDVTMDHGHMIRAFFKARAALEGEECDVRNV